MDNLSIKILKKVRCSRGKLKEEELYSKYGSNALTTLQYLADMAYISSNNKNCGVYLRDDNDAYYNLIYSITPLGLDFLESLPGVKADRWITRICAIIGAITGISALVWEIIDHLSAG